jgi:Rps23 Pro-64 3,4-dihydroxylase Tpa1-like proline 4-hydroxylase
VSKLFKPANSPIVRSPAYVRISSKWFKKNADDIINKLDKKIIPGTTVNNNSSARKSDVFLWDIWKIDLIDLQKVIIYKLKEIFIEENKKFQFDLDYSSINVQYTKYQKGDFYTWHTDDDFNATHKKHQNVRKLSITAALNVGSYEGGDLQIILNYQKEPRTMRLEFGDALVFPSFTQHQITPITEGIRYSLVSWVSGPPWR